jgi:hypothetical protein
MSLKNLTPMSAKSFIEKVTASGPRRGSGNAHIPGTGMPSTAMRGTPPHFKTENVSASTDRNETKANAVAAMVQIDILTLPTPLIGT